MQSKNPRLRKKIWHEDAPTRSGYIEHVPKKPEITKSESSVHLIPGLEITVTNDVYINQSSMLIWNITAGCMLRTNKPGGTSRPELRYLMPYWRSGRFGIETTEQLYLVIDVNPKARFYKTPTAVPAFGAYETIMMTQSKYSCKHDELKSDKILSIQGRLGAWSQLNAKLEIVQQRNTATFCYTVPFSTSRSSCDIKQFSTTEDILVNAAGGVAHVFGTMFKDISETMLHRYHTRYPRIVAESV